MNDSIPGTYKLLSMIEFNTECKDVLCGVFIFSAITTSVVTIQV